MKVKNKEAGLSSLHVIEKIITIVQYVLVSIVIFVVLQILFSSTYYRDLLIVSSTVSYGLGIFLIGVLSWRLFS
jgi:hypothetical protein